MNKCVEDDKIKRYDTKVVFENIETGDYYEYYITEMEVK